MSPQPCGTRASYVRGCRCDDCRTANLAYQAEWAKNASPATRARRRESNKRYRRSEKGRATQQRYNDAHRAEIRARGRAYYAANSEMIKSGVAAAQDREQADTIATSSRHGAEWTATEDAELIRLYGTIPVRELAAHLHRTAYGIRNRVQILRRRGEL